MPDNTVKGAQATAEALSTEALAEAASTIAQQQALIGELQSARQSAVKTAAALAEAAKLAQEGRIDLEDIFETADRLLKSGNVKLSSLDEVFDQSPGDLLGPEAEANAGRSATPPSAPGADPLTAALRQLR